MAQDISDVITSLFPSRIPDNDCAAAYENTPAPYRAALKTAIALTMFHFGMRNGSKSEAREDNFAGFKEESAQFSLREAYLCIQADYPAPALVCAAAMLPVLAGVEEICCILAGAKPSPRILVTLELCGIENRFCCPIEKAEQVLKRLTGSMRKVFLLHDGKLAHLSQICAEKNIDYLDVNKLPRILCGIPNKRHLLEFAFGSQSVGDEGLSHPDLILAAGGEKSDHSARLLVGPGCECFWLFENLTPDTFKFRQGRFFMTASETDDKPEWK